MEHLLLDLPIEVHIKLQSLTAQISVVVLNDTTRQLFKGILQSNHFASKCVENTSAHCNKVNFLILILPQRASFSGAGSHMVV